MGFIKELTRIKDISDYAQGSAVSFTACILNVAETGTEENPKISLRVYDGYEPVTLFIWKPAESWQEDLPVGIIKKFYGDITGDKKHYIKVTSTESLKQTEELLKKYKPQSYKKLLESNRHYFISSVEKIKDLKFRRYVEIAYGIGDVPQSVTKSAYKETNANQFNGFASISRHDSYSGGNINHIVGHLRIIDALQDIYGVYPIQRSVGRVEWGSSTDWDYIRTLSLLHDIGKQSTYYHITKDLIAFNPDIKLTHEEMGIVVLTKVHSVVEKEFRLSEAKLQMLYSGIIHHGDGPDYSGSTTSEDNIVRNIDAIEAIMSDTLIL